MHVAHAWLYHLDACGSSVLTPYDDITNVQKRLGNSVDRLWSVPPTRLLPPVWQKYKNGIRMQIR